MPSVPLSRSVSRIGKIRCQPSLRLRDAHSLPAGIILHLISANLSHTEVDRFWMGEVPSADRGGRPHGVALGKLDAGAASDVEHLEQTPLLGVIGTSGISRSGTDPAVLF